MPQGMQVWDASGNLILDFTTRTGFIRGTLSITTSNQSGSTTDSTIVEGDIWYITLMNAGGGDPGDAPVVTKSGTTITWTRFDATRTWQGTILYGVG